MLSKDRHLSIEAQVIFNRGPVFHGANRNGVFA